MPSHIRRLRDTLRTRLGGPRDSDVVGAPGSIQLRNVTAGYGGTPVFLRFDLHIDPGEFVYLVGPSGAGKSTLLKILFGTVQPEEGWVTVDGIAVHRLQHWQTDTIRRRVGCVFQTYELLAHLTALENVLLPLQLAHPRTRQARQLATEALELVGLAGKLKSLPATLSGGQQQRVAVARALVSRPDIIFADEPTGNLDSRTGTEILSFMRTAVRELGQTIVMVTHDTNAARYADRTVVIVDGQVTSC